MKKEYFYLEYIKTQQPLEMRIINLFNQLNMLMKIILMVLLN